jgi:hypothetical protein
MNPPTKKAPAFFSLPDMHIIIVNNILLNKPHSVDRGVQSLNQVTDDLP